ncbi:hypothetical protein D3C73_1274400 [compost metagenome]
MNAESVTDASAQMTSYGENYDAASQDSLQEFFDSYEYNYTLNNSNVYYYDSGEAAVYVETTIHDAVTRESYEQPMLFIYYKSDSGAWTIDDFYYLD